MGKRFKVREIRGSELVVCPRCKVSSELDKWDEVTREECDTSGKKADFVSLGFIRSWKKESDLYYKCPVCKLFSNSATLKITGTTDNKLRALGGEKIDLDMVVVPDTDRLYKAIPTLSGKQSKTSKQSKALYK